MERHRHNLPEWLVQPLKTSWATEFWPLVNSLGEGLGWTCASTPEGQAAPTCRRRLARGRHQGRTHAVFSRACVAGKPAVNKA